MYPSYKAAVQWIADNDNAGEDYSVEELSASITVVLVADLFGKSPEKVATAVLKMRIKNDNS